MARETPARTGQPTTTIRTPADDDPSPAASAPSAPDGTKAAGATAASGEPERRAGGATSEDGAAGGGTDRTDRAGRPDRAPERRAARESDRGRGDRDDSGEERKGGRAAGTGASRATDPAPPTDQPTTRLTLEDVDQKRTPASPTGTGRPGPEEARDRGTGASGSAHPDSGAARESAAGDERRTTAPRPQPAGTGAAASGAGRGSGTGTDARPGASDEVTVPVDPAADAKPGALDEVTVPVDPAADAKPGKPDMTTVPVGRGPAAKPGVPDATTVPVEPAPAAGRSGSKGTGSASAPGSPHAGSQVGTSAAPKATPASDAASGSDAASAAKDTPTTAFGTVPLTRRPADRDGEASAAATRPAPKASQPPGGAPPAKPTRPPSQPPRASKEDVLGRTQPLPRHPGAQSGSRPERDPERTSKFVALKPDMPPPPGPGSGPDRAARPGQPPAGAPGAKPPLDLLAELTNSPPPPQTPLRTALRKVKIYTPLVVLLAIIYVVVQALRPLPDPSFRLTAAESYAFEGDRTTLPWPDEGQGWMDVSGVGTMDHFGAQRPVPIGSVAKAMTAYVVLKDHPLKIGEEGPRITVDATAEKEGSYDSDGESTLNTIKEGDRLTLRQALAAIMIPSANNVARLLARWDAGSSKAFVAKMNATAKQLGMKHTTYTDPSGLTASTVSTAEDQVKLGDELVKVPALMALTKLPQWEDPSGRKWRNYNTLVPYDGAIGIKTGTTTKAGGNLLFAATKEVGGQTVTVVGAILGQHKSPIIDTVNAVSKTALLAARDALRPATVLKKGEVVGYVDDGLGGHTPVVVTKDVTAVGWAGLRVGLRLTDSGDDPLPHDAKAGTKVGVLTIGGGGASAGTGGGKGSAIKVPVALQKDLVEPGFGAKLTRLG